MGLNVEGNVFKVGSVWFVWSFVLRYVDGLVVGLKELLQKKAD